MISHFVLKLSKCCNTPLPERLKNTTLQRFYIDRIIAMVVVSVWFGGYPVLFMCSFLVFAHGDLNYDEDEWIDPYDMLNYDSASKSMKKPSETYNNVPTKRREYSGEVPNCPDYTQCTRTLERLRREFEEHKRRLSFSSQQPTCHPVFRRFLAKLLKEIQNLDLPSDVNAAMHYDAEVKLSKQSVAEIQKLLTDDDSWKTGALDDALSQILINFKFHDYEAWKWHFVDTFGVELDTMIKIFVCVLIIVAIICTEMWSVVSWFVQFKRMFAVCFFISIVWNWFYLYKIAFAEHQAKVVKVENVNDKCTGLTKIDWKDNLKEWFRSTWTLQDDPCKEYYEVLMVNPVLLVPPTKAITVTITTFITDPLKHLGQGISEFLRALLKDLPITLQIPVLLTIVLSILVFMYGSAQAAIQHAALRPLRGGRREPPAPAVEQPHSHPLMDSERHEDRVIGANGHAEEHSQQQQNADQEAVQINRTASVPNIESRPDVRQRRPYRPREQRQKVFVETLRNADNLYSGDETDNQREAMASAPETENKSLNDNIAKEELEASAQRSGEPKHSQPTFKEQISKSISGDNETQDLRQNHKKEPTSVQTSIPEKKVQNIGSPDQETIR